MARQYAQEMKLFELAELFNEKQPRKVDGKIIRGGRPLTTKAIDQLKEMGVDTVVSFLKPHRTYPAMISNVADEKAAVEAAGMEFHNIPMEERTGPDERDIVKFLNIVKNSSGTIYMHCSAGRDRVGLMNAIYDVQVRGLSFEEAYENYLRGGHDFYSWPNLDRYFYQWYKKNHGGEPNVKKVINDVVPGGVDAENLIAHVTN